MKTTDCLIRCYYSSYAALFFACGAIGIAAEGILGDSAALNTRLA